MSKTPSTKPVEESANGVTPESDEKSLEILVNFASKAQYKLDILQAETAEAERVAREAWDAVYAHLVALKNANSHAPVFKTSKLGKLLEQIR